MLPIYEAIDVVKVIGENVGHTKPWVVYANTPQGLKSFVVKLYTTAQVDNFQHCVTKEVICNKLATEFDLKVPGCAFIEIPYELAMRRPAIEQEQFDDSDTRLKFATELIDNVNISIPNLNKEYLKKKIPIDTLYAFDNLIRNCDRGYPKPNLLIGSKDAYLIDHEFTLLHNHIIGIDFDTLQLDDKFTKNHIFFPYLKKTIFKNKQNFFKDFSFYLNNLNINSLNPLFQQLANLGFENYSQPIIYWLNQVKQNNTIFVNKLKGTLQ